MWLVLGGEEQVEAGGGWFGVGLVLDEEEDVELKGIGSQQVGAELWHCFQSISTPLKPPRTS